MNKIMKDGMMEVEMKEIMMKTKKCSKIMEKRRKNVLDIR